MMLRGGLRHELSYALVKGAIEHNIGTGAERGADTFVFTRRPFSENCRSIKFDVGTLPEWLALQLRLADPGSHRRPRARCRVERDTTNERTRPAQHHRPYRGRSGGRRA